jgi:hypothetical protein
VFFARRLLPPPTLTATALRGVKKRFQEEEEEEELVEQKEEHALGVAIVRILPFSVLITSAYYIYAIIKSRPSLSLSLLKKSLVVALSSLSLCNDNNDQPAKAVVNQSSS